MQVASDNLDYEKAAKLRDQIRSVREIQQKQYISGESDNFDIVACVKNGDHACIQLSFIRSGLNLGSRKYYPRNIDNKNESNLIKAFLSHFYLRGLDHKKYSLEISILLVFNSD